MIEIVKKDLGEIVKKDPGKIVYEAPQGPYTHTEAKRMAVKKLKEFQKEYPSLLRCMWLLKSHHLDRLRVREELKHTEIMIHKLMKACPLDEFEPRHLRPKEEEEGK
jgi:hypothetical protein